MVTILPTSTYELGREYTPDYDARKCVYFIPVIIWKRTPVVAKTWFDDTHDIIEGTLVISEANIGVIRSVSFIVNRSGSIKLESYHQTNLQSDGTWYVNPNPVEGLGLIGIIL